MRWFAAGLGLLSLLATGARAETYTAREICECVVTSLSADGRAATGHLNYSQQTFRWAVGEGLQPLGRGTMRKLGAPFGWPDRRHGLASTANAMVWIDGAPTILGAGMAFGVNAAGDIVVGGAPRAPSNRLTPAMWAWRDGAWHRRLLGTVAGQGFSEGYATGVSDDGRIVVGHGWWAGGGWRPSAPSSGLRRTGWWRPSNISSPAATRSASVCS